MESARTQSLPRSKMRGMAKGMGEEIDTRARSPQVGGLDIKPHLAEGGAVVAKALDGLAGLGGGVLRVGEEA